MNYYKQQEQILVRTDTVSWWKRFLYLCCRKVAFVWRWHLKLRCTSWNITGFSFKFDSHDLHPLWLEFAQSWVYESKFEVKCFSIFTYFCVHSKLKLFDCFLLKFLHPRELQYNTVNQHLLNGLKGSTS